jgi:hypothetical protein
MMQLREKPSMGKDMEDRKEADQKEREYKLILKLGGVCAK